MGDAGTGTASKYNGWDNMFRGKFDTKIREWQNIFYRTDVDSTPADTNEFQLFEDHSEAKRWSKKP